eukprot:SAG31_NODE_8519_length_1437_cov_1.297459_2_plen_84_part_00
MHTDEIAYDRVTMLRARKVLGDSGMIDHHSDCGGFTKSPAINYMELYPFINRLWCKCGDHTWSLCYGYCCCYSFAAIWLWLIA